LKGEQDNSLINTITPSGKIWLSLIIMNEGVQFATTDPQGLDCYHQEVMHANL